MECKNCKTKINKQMGKVLFYNGLVFCSHKCRFSYRVDLIINK